MIPPAVAAPFAFLVGLLVGSFANVCIWRLPRGESVVTPRSRCPRCAAPIAAFDNIPVVSWLLLRGRCRACRAPISPRYPLIELTVGVLFAVSAWAYGATADAVAVAVLSAACVILAVTDLEVRLIPDEVTLATLGLGVVIAFAKDLSRTPDSWLSGSFAASLYGALAGAGILLLVRWAYLRLRGVEGMGMGDVTMTAMAGAFVGPGGVLVLLLCASLLGSVIGGGVILLRRLRWWRLLRRTRSSEDLAEAGRAAGLLLDGTGAVGPASASWLEIPGAARPGERVWGSTGAARTLLAVLRLGRIRALHGRATEVGRLAVEDETGLFFRVLAVRVEPLGARLLVLLGRSDVPFGVFLAVAAVLVKLAGRPAVAILTGNVLPLFP